jgi:hypothetical protein
MRYTYQPGKTETKEKTNCPLQKKNLNGGVAILLKQNRFGDKIGNL